MPYTRCWFCCQKLLQIPELVPFVCFVTWPTTSPSSWAPLQDYPFWYSTKDFTQLQELQSWARYLCSLSTIWMRCGLQRRHILPPIALDDGGCLFGLEVLLLKKYVNIIVTTCVSTLSYFVHIKGVASPPPPYRSMCNTRISLALFVGVGDETRKWYRWWSRIQRIGSAQRKSCNIRLNQSIYPSLVMCE